MSHRLSVCMVAVLCVILAGCGRSTPIRFYTLSTPASTDAIARQADQGDKIMVAVGPIEVPAYLDRPQIVSRINQNEIDLNEFHQWAEPIKDSFERALMENLASKLSADGMEIVSWHGARSVDYQISVKISSFDGTMGESAILVATWSVYEGKGKKRIIAEKSRIEKKIKGGDIGALVAAQSRALEDLSDRIALAIEKISP